MTYEMIKAMSNNDRAALAQELNVNTPAGDMPSTDARRLWAVMKARQTFIGGTK